MLKFSKRVKMNITLRIELENMINEKVKSGKYDSPGEVVCEVFFFSSRRRHTRYWRDWSSDVCSSDLGDGCGAYAVPMADTRPIGFWLRLVDRLLEERFAHVLEEHGVTRGQWQLLNVVSRGGAPADEVERAVEPFTSADGTPVSAQLAELIESGWVELSGTEYRLTKRGETAHHRLAEVIGELRTHSTEGISGDDYAS